MSTLYQLLYKDLETRLPKPGEIWEYKAGTITGGEVKALVHVLGISRAKVVTYRKIAYYSSWLDRDLKLTNKWSEVWSTGFDRKGWKLVSEV